MGEKLPQNLLDDLRSAFFMFDYKRDGRVSAREVGPIVQSVGLCPTMKELKDLEKEVDTTFNGAVDYNGLCRIIEKRLHEQRKTDDLEMVTTPQQLRDAFSVFDRDGDGIVSVHDLRHSLTTLGEYLGDEELDELIREVDADGTGSIKYEDMIAVLLKK